MPLPPGSPVSGVFHASITCAGEPPMGACCDMYLTDENGNSVCRDVPQVNCPGLTPRADQVPDPSTQQHWIEGAACEASPFPHPCGVSACCVLDQKCENLTETQCTAKAQDRPHKWQKGAYCESGSQHCPFGDCLITRTGPGCWSPECERQICAFDAWCCEVEWDYLCVRHAQDRCDGSRRNSTCAPSSSDESDGPYELPMNSVIQYAGYGWLLDSSRTGFSCYPEELKHCEWYPDTSCKADTDCYVGTCIPITDPVYQGFYPSWFQFTATSDSARVHTCPSFPSAIDTIVEVFAATDHSTPYSMCSTLQSLGCNDNAQGCNDVVGADLCVTGLSRGETYVVKVAGVTSDDLGIIELTIESPCLPVVFVPESEIVRVSPTDVVLLSSDAIGSTLHLRTSKREPTAPTVEPARLHREVPRDAWMPRPASPPASAMLHCGSWVWNGFESIQVNVDANGCNIVGDAANEPSIAIDSTDPSRIVIGWRQFDSVASDFRKAGWAYSHDAGRTWTFPGTLQNGAWRSDPVLGAGPDGTIFFYSIDSGLAGTLFASFDGGVTWPQAQPAYGGDKPWMAVDQTAGIGRGNIYVTWTGGGFTRSVDGGWTFSIRVSIPGSPNWGTITVGPDGTVYVAGSGLVAQSRNAKDPDAIVTFYTVAAPTGGGFGPEANPAGLVGQAWIAADHSGGPRHGYLYLFSPTAKFSRSTDSGLAWSDQIGVNHPTDRNAAWFGMMSVAPNGRIDAAWNDFAVGCDNPQHCYQLFYSSSTDGGDTWSDPIAVSPPWDSWIGWPGGQQKIGDYYHMVSDYNGVNIAYAATFNGEQDVNFLRIGPPPDCNHNGLPDREDVL
ncbi:MAG: sialidase family protein, partial [Phycisphaerales bacterium]|nr:sialidase family protein [Phycisphaerales bacterium]